MFFHITMHMVLALAIATAGLVTAAPSDPSSMVHFPLFGENIHER